MRLTQVVRHALWRVPDDADLTEQGIVVTARVFAAARVLALMVCVSVAAFADDRDGGRVVLFAALSLPWAFVTTVWQVGAPREAGFLRWGAPSLGDILLIFALMSASGGAQSPIRLTFLVLAFVAAIAAQWAELVVLVIFAIGVRALAFGFGESFWIFTIEGLWALGCAVAVARSRADVMRRWTELDDARRTLRAAQVADRERTAAAVLLRRTALEPLELVLARLREATTLAGLRHAGTVVGHIAATIRSGVAELHALAEREPDLRVVLRTIAARRFPQADVTTEGLTRLKPDEAVLAVDLLASALADLTDRATTAVAVEVGRAGGEGATMTVVCHPPRASPPADGALAERVRLVGAELVDLGPGTVTVRLARHALTPAAPMATPGAALGGHAAVVVAIRALCFPAALAVGVIDGGPRPGFYAAGGLLALLSPVAIRTALASRARAPWWIAVLAVDVAGVVTMAATVGSGRDALAPMLLTAPVCAGLVVGVIPTLIASAVAGAGFVLAGEHQTNFLLVLAWSTAIAVLLAAGTTLLAVGVERTARRRVMLLTGIRAAEEAERREIADTLHDDVLQLLLAARQDLEEAGEDGDPGTLERATDTLLLAAGALRRTAESFDAAGSAPRIPGGVEAILGELAEGLGRRGGAALTWTVEDVGDEGRDGLLVRLTRELVTNAIKHADASRIDVAIERAPHGVVLVVRDDGVGADQLLVDNAVERGHVGLASCRERVAAVGGVLTLVRGRPRGTIVEVELPGVGAAAPVG